MKIQKYISIPETQSIRNSLGTNSKYISYLQLLISLLSGILLIALRQITCRTVRNGEGCAHSPLQQNEQIQNSNISIERDENLAILYPFLFTIISKIVIAVNYLCRNKKIKSHLKIMAQVKIGNLLIPAFLKSLFYTSILLGTLYIQDGVMLITVILSVLLIQFVNWWQKSNYLSFKALSLIKIGKKSQSSKFLPHLSQKSLDVRDIITEILLVLSIGLAVSTFQSFRILMPETIVLILVCGTLCCLSYYYLHSKIFQLYETEIDQLMAKQYIIEVINYIIFCLVYYFFTFNPDSNTNFIKENHETNATLSNQNSQNDASILRDHQTSKFIFILQFPIHTLICVCMVFLYEYLSFQMLKKVEFKYLFLTQLSSIFWFHIYTIRNEGFQLKIYIATFIALFGIISLMRIFSVDKLSRKVIGLFNYFQTRGNSNRSRNKNKTMKLDQQLEIEIEK